jgi:ATP/maltotriose-dependent transcriptional regulator MalT
MELCERYGFPGTRAIVVANLTDVALRDDDLDSAAKYAGRAMEAAEAVGSRGIIPIVRSYEALIAIRRGEFDRARAAIAAGLAVATELGSQPTLFGPLISYAELRLALGQLDEARTVLAATAAHPAVTHDVRDRIRAVEARLPPRAGAAPASPIAFDQLVERVLTESSAAPAPLPAALAGHR